METIFDQETRDKIIARINTLTEGNAAQWGKMDIRQMLAHCTMYEEMLQGKRKFKRIFLGRLFGKVAMKDIIGDARPVKRNLPTIPELKVFEPGINFAAEKKKWIALLDAYANFGNQDSEHAFFGKITNQQIGYLSYKHADHHLRQFNS